MENKNKNQIQNINKNCNSISKILCNTETCGHLLWLFQRLCPMSEERDLDREQLRLQDPERELEYEYCRRRGGENDLELDRERDRDDELDLLLEWRDLYL